MIRSLRLLLAGGALLASPLVASAQYAGTFNQLFIIGIVIAALFFLAAPLINKLMHGVK